MLFERVHVFGFLDAHTVMTKYQAITGDTNFRSIIVYKEDTQMNLERQEFRCRISIKFKVSLCFIQTLHNVQKPCFTTEINLNFSAQPMKNGFPLVWKTSALLDRFGSYYQLFRFEQYFLNH